MWFVLGQATERFKKRQIPGPKPYYSTNEWPSLWFEPTEVWEVRARQCNAALRGAVCGSSVRVERAACSLPHSGRPMSSPAELQLCIGAHA